MATKYLVILELFRISMKIFLIVKMGAKLFKAAKKNAKVDFMAPLKSIVNLGRVNFQQKCKLKIFSEYVNIYKTWLT